MTTSSEPALHPSSLPATLNPSPTHNETPSGPHRSRKERTDHRLPTKRRGEVAEAAFLLKASSLGFSVAKPWGDSDRYDFILDNGNRTFRVQVKTASMVATGAFSIHACGSVPSRTYTADEIDFLVAYIVSAELWYVLPVHLFTKIRHVKFHPFRKQPVSRYEKYREAWCMMACPNDGPCHKEVEVVRWCEKDAKPCGSDTLVRPPGGWPRL